MEEVDVRMKITQLLEGRQLPQGVHYWNGSEQISELAAYRNTLGERERRLFDKIIINDYILSDEYEKRRLGVTMAVFSRSPDCIDSIVERLGNQ